MTTTKTGNGEPTREFVVVLTLAAQHFDCALIEGRIRGAMKRIGVRLSDIHAYGIQPDPFTVARHKHEEGDPPYE